MASPTPASALSQRGGPLVTWRSDNTREVSSSPRRQMAALGSVVARSDVHYDVSSADESASMLEADTRYLPLDLNVSPLRPFNFGSSQHRPQTAPAASDIEASQRPEADRQVAASVDVTRLGHLASPSAACRELTFDEHDSRLRPSARISRLAANFAMQQQRSPDGLNMKPTHSELQPQSHVGRRSVSPVMRAQEFSSEADSTMENGGLSTLRLEELKAAIMASRKGRRSRDHAANLDMSRSSQGSLYASQYSPEKYATPTRRSLYRSSAAEPAEPQGGDPTRLHPAAHHVDVLAVHQERPQLQKLHGKVQEADMKEQTLAATKLQALWRGFLARHRDPGVTSVKQEMRARRAEEHIQYLRAELDKQKKLYEEEKQLRTMQLQVLQYLCQQIQVIQQWQSSAQASQDRPRPTPTPAAVLTPPHPTGTASVLNPQQLVQTVEKARSGSRSLDLPVPTRGTASPSTSLSMGQNMTPEVLASQVSTQTTTISTPKELQLEEACNRLQKQVSQLQEMLTHMSNYVFQGGVISADQEDNGEEEEERNLIRVSADFEPGELLEAAAQSRQSTGGNRCSSVVLGTHQKVPLPGIPTAPQELQVLHHLPDSIVLQWQPSHIQASNGRILNKPLIGYRIYVDGQAKGMVAGTQTRALLEGLYSTSSYRLSVRAVSALGESVDSNLVVVSPDSESDESKSSRSQHHRDSDRDQDFTDGQPCPQKGHNDSGSGSGSLGDGETHNKAHLPGGVEEDGSGLSFLSSPKAGSASRQPQTSTPKKAATKVAKVSPASEKPSDKVHCLKADSSFSEVIKEPKARLSVVQRLEKQENKSNSSSGSRQLPSPTRSPSHRSSKDGRASPRASRSPSSERSDGKVEAKETETERTLSAGSPRLPEGLIKKLEATKEKGMWGEMKRTSMLKRKTSPGDPHGPLRAFNHQAPTSDTYSTANTNSKTDDRTSCSKIPVFKAGKTEDDRDEQRCSSFDFASLRELLPLTRSQSAGSLAGGAFSSDRTDRPGSRLSDLKGAKLDASSGATELDFEPVADRADLASCDSGTVGSDSERMYSSSRLHSKCSPDSSPERDCGIGEVDGQRRRQHSGSSQDLEHSEDLQNDGRRPPYGSGSLTQEAGLGPRSGSGSNLFEPKPPESPRSAAGLTRRNSLKKKDGSSSGSKEGDSSLSPSSMGSTTGTDTTGSLASLGISPLEVNVIVQENTSDPVIKTVQGDAVVYTQLPNKEESGPSFSSQPSANPRSSGTAEVSEICHDFSSGVDSETDRPLRRQTRGRSSARVMRSKKDKSERRSASVGSVMQRVTGGCCSSSATNVIVANKPPLAKPAQFHGADGDQSSGFGTKHRSPSREELAARKAGRRRNNSEHGIVSSSEEEEPANAVGSKMKSGNQASALRHKQQPVQIAARHRRCNSDATSIQILPDQPVSPTTRHRHSGPPSTPTHAPSSPRTRRSSSFSKALGLSPEKEQQSIVRKPMSSKELKAARVEERKQVVQKTLGYDRNAKKLANASSPGSCDAPETEKTEAQSHPESATAVSQLVTTKDEARGSPSSSASAAEPLTAAVETRRAELEGGTASVVSSSETPQSGNPLRRSESSGRVHDLIRQFSNTENNNEPTATVRRSGSLKETRSSAKPVTTVAGTSEALSLTSDVQHSPKLVGKQVIDPKNRQKVKIGRAADLFAKLHMKLSPKS